MEKEEDGTLADGQDPPAKQKRLLRFLTVALIVVAVTASFYFLFRTLGFLDADSLSESLQNDGMRVYAIFIALFVIQALCLCMIPGNTTLFIMTAWILFDGDFWTVFPVCLMGVWLSGIALFFLGRYGGRRLIYWLFNKENVDKRLDWLSTKGAKMLPIFFLIPFMPNDMICAVCGMSKLKFWKFMLIIIPFRMIEVLMILTYPRIIDHFFPDGLPV